MTQTVAKSLERTIIQKVVGVNNNPEVFAYYANTSYSSTSFTHILTPLLMLQATKEIRVEVSEPVLLSSSPLLWAVF
jgi:hypothetical protein